MTHPVKEPRDCSVMVRFTGEEYKRILKACGGQEPAVYVRECALAGGSADPDPRIAQVSLRSRCGRWNGVVGVFTLARAVEMVKLRERQGWTGEITIVPEQPKVGPALTTPEEQIARLTIDDITAARLRDEGRRAPKT